MRHDTDSTNPKPATQWAYPFALRDKTAADAMYTHFAVLAKMDRGFFPMATNGFAQGSIHFGLETGEGFDLKAGFRALADGEVIAYRLDSELRKLDYDHDLGERVIAYSTGFTLVRHWLPQLPKPPSTRPPTMDEVVEALRNPPPPEGIYVYSLYYYNRPFSVFPKVQGSFPLDYLPFWKGHRIFRVSDRSRDKQQLAADACPVEDPTAPWFHDRFATSPQPLPPPTPRVGLNVRAEGRKDAEIIGVLIRGSIITVEGDVTHGWAKIRTIHDGFVAPPLLERPDVPGAETGWVYVGEMDSAISPDAPHLNRVVVLDTPYPVKAGERLGWLGSSPGIPAPLGKLVDAPVMALEVFAGDDLPGFIATSRERAATLPADQRTVLVVEVGARLPLYHAFPDEHYPGSCTVRPLAGQRAGRYRRGIVYRKVARLPETLTADEKKAATGYICPHTGEDRIKKQDLHTLKKSEQKRYTHVEIEELIDGREMWTETVLDTRGYRPVLAWKAFPMRLGAPPFDEIICPVETRLTLAQLQGLPEDHRAVDEHGVRWWLIPIAANPPTEAWVCEKDHPGTHWAAPAAWPGFELVDATTFSLLEAFQRAAVVQGFVLKKHHEAFSPIASALGHSELIVKLEQAIDAAGDLNGQVSAKEIRKARETPALAQRLSRLIVKFESHWSDNVERWTTLNHLMNADWKREMERQLNRNFWSKVASKIPSFPQDPHVWHMHPLGWVDNFMPAEDLRVTRLINAIMRALELGEARSYEAYNAGTDENYRVLVSRPNPPSGTVTSKTIDEIIMTESRRPSDPGRLFATGRYQTIIPTLREARDALGMTGRELYTSATQDRIFTDYLIRKAGGGALASFIYDNKGTVDEAQLAAAKEWASFAVPEGLAISKRFGGHVSDGTMSYYERLGEGGKRTGGNHANLAATAILRNALIDHIR